MTKVLKIDPVSAELFKQLSKGFHDVAFMDEKNGVWYLYSVDTGGFDVHSFGDIAITFINIGLSLQADSPNVQANTENYVKGGLSPSFVQGVQDNAVKCRQGLVDLKNRLLTMQKARKTLSPFEYSAFAMNTLYAYSPLYDFAYWASHCSDVDANNYDGFPMTSAYRSCERFTVFTAYRCKESVPVTVTINSEAVTGRVFRLDRSFGAGCLFPVDLRYLIQQQCSVHECVRCGQLYVQNNASSRYCPECKHIVGKRGIANERRRNNEARYLHKRILDKLNSKANTSGVNPEDFRKESNYYWDRINGKTPAAMPKFASEGIKTKEQYREWLNAVVVNPYAYLNGRYDKIDKKQS